MKKIGRLLSGSEEFRYEFDVPIELAIERLSSNVNKVSILPRASEEMVGNISGRGVKIWRVIPRVRNSFSPVLVGTFTEEGSKTVLAGVFRFHRAVQAFMMFWFAFVVFWVMFASLMVFVNPSMPWYMPFTGLLMICFGIGLIKIGKRGSRQDPIWLKENISDTINES